jgi:hypothetical protein
MHMPYRADLEAQKQRCDVLEGELAELRLRASALADAQRDIVAKEREVATAQKMLAGMGVKRALPLLDSLRVASPCRASWDDMVGDERVRFCGQCAKNVYNLSAMAREEAETVIRAKDGNLCVRMYQRADGTVMTTDCPVGVRKKRVRKAAVAAVGGGLMAAGWLSMASSRMGAVRTTQGAVAYEVVGDMAAPIDPRSTPPAVSPPPPQQPTPSIQGHAAVMGRMRPHANTK